MRSILLALVLGVTIPVVLYSGYLMMPKNETQALSGFGDPFVSIQLATSPSNGDCLTTDGTNNAWDTCGAGGSSKWTDATTFIYPTGGLYASAPKFVATSSTYSEFPYASSTAITATNFWGTASLATALGANGANCTAGNYPLGVDASGAVEDCTAITSGGSNWTSDGTRLTPSTTVGIGVFASSTIGDGTATGGLTISGNSTTTGNLYVTGGVTQATNITNTFAGRLIVSNALGIESSGKVTASSNLYTTASGADLWLGTATQSLSLASMRATGVTTLGTTTQSGTSMLTVGGDAWIGGNLTATGTLTVTPLTSALTLTGADGAFAEYAGTSCTNQMVTGLSALGVATCETIDLTDTNITAGDALTITANDIDFDGGATPSGDLGGTWASPSVTDDSHNHTGTTLSGIDISSDTNLSADGTEIVLTGDALSLGTALTFTTGTSTTSFFSALGTFTNLVVNTLATFLNVVVTGLLDVGGGSLEIPNGTAPTVDAIGEIAVDSTYGQFKYFDGGTTHVLTGTTTRSFSIASTTSGTGGSFNTATTTFLLANNPEATTLIGWYCQATTTGSVNVRFGDGTNWTNNANCSTGGTTYATSNNTFTAFENFQVQIGSSASSPNRVTITTFTSKTAQ